MSASSTHIGASDYNANSLRHEERMLAAYRRRAQDDAAALQPLANACLRAASFAWAVRRDADAVRKLWGEGALALSRGFARKRAGFDPSPDQLILAFNLSIAAREKDAFNALAHTSPDLRSGALRDAQAFRDSRAHFHLAESYTLIAHSLVERKSASAQRAAESLHAARQANDAGWWSRQFPGALEAAWRKSEHEAVCALLSAVADSIAGTPTAATQREAKRATANDHASANLAPENASGEFASAIDDALLRLKQFAESDVNHHPKLYVWLPGVALCALASSAGLSFDWLHERTASQSPGYSRMPLELLSRTVNA